MDFKHLKQFLKHKYTIKVNSHQHCHLNFLNGSDNDEPLDCFSMNTS